MLTVDHTRPVLLATALPTRPNPWDWDHPTHLTLDIFQEIVHAQKQNYCSKTCIGSLAHQIMLGHQTSDQLKTKHPLYCQLTAIFQHDLIFQEDKSQVLRCVKCVCLHPVSLSQHCLYNGCVLTCAVCASISQPNL